MNKGLLTLLLLFTCFAHAQVVDTWQFANPQQQQQALNIASQLRCPQCQNQNLLESNAPVAVSMRHQVYSMVAEGKNEVEIIGWMTERYGDFVRYNPPLTGYRLSLTPQIPSTQDHSSHPYRGLSATFLTRSLYWS